METRDVISLISKIREKVNRFIVQEMEKQGVEGIGTSHGDIIYALLQKPKMTMADIARRIHKDKSTVTPLVNKLAGLGIVTKERDKEDTRFVYVTLTAKGRELEGVFEVVSAEMLGQFYRNVSEEEQEILLQILLKINNNF
ncbi:MarR family transcriptional regulator [Paenibacillus sp. MMS20-IR301]|uniref:MarR family winged helix-turn-helix transcriptional regulator n=1 Tax=Paenibacillus sp. MMS20-IR301 TaxID=2895946 RepID=UPI0028E46991|nr:MarR family transcriptional regulator [Paenibacillus sp. MMS20-IR301]WNS43418.1 MarR family transcriptional regulator [Paenibacillus sp. MMS20-IR301]